MYTFTVGSECKSVLKIYLSFLQRIINLFILLKLLQLCFNENLSDMHHLLDGQSQALDRVAELLLKQTHHFHKHAEGYIAYSNMPCCHTQE